MTSAKQDASSIYFGLEITRRCNLHCPHCFTDSSIQAHAGPSRESLRELFAQLVRVGARRLAISGGEPLIRPDLEQIMADGLRLGLRGYSLVTNGSLAEPKRVRRLKQAGLKAVQVSIDGVDERDHCAIRACSARVYYRALNALRVYREAGVRVAVATILVGPNLQRAPQMVLLCQALGVNRLRYCSFVPTGRAAQEAIQREYVPEPAQVDAFLEFFRSFTSRNHAPVELMIDHGVGPYRADGRFKCVAGRKVAYITGEGNLYPCPSLMAAPFLVGNVFETDLAELVASPALHWVRRIRRHELAEPCRSCENKKCSGGCRGAAYAATGDVYAAPAYCNFQRRKGASEPRREHRPRVHDSGSTAT